MRSRAAKVIYSVAMWLRDGAMWIERRRQRREALGNGEPWPPPRRLWMP